MLLPEFEPSWNLCGFSPLPNGERVRHPSKPCLLQLGARFDMLLAVFVFTFASVLGQNDIDFTLWNNVVQTYVKPGEKDTVKINIVDYQGISNDSDFHSFLRQLSSQQTISFTNDTFYSLFMNAYNAFTINMIITHPCIPLNMSNGQCKQISTIWDISPNVFNLPAGIIGGKTYSLNDIEGMLRNPSTYDPLSCMPSPFLSKVPCSEKKGTRFRHPLFLSFFPRHLPHTKTKQKKNKKDLCGESTSSFLYSMRRSVMSKCPSNGFYSFEYDK